MLFRKYRFSKNEGCPCGSDLLYKDCCMIKKPRQFHNNNEALNHSGKMMKKSRIKICLHDGCKAKLKDIIRAHALQENRILNKIAVDKNVIMQNFSKAPTICEIEPGKPEPFYFLTEVPITDATVATCFCKTHDDALFAKIEKSQYDLETLDSEQLFLFAYKTFAFELYTEIVAKKFQASMFSTVPQLTKEPLSVHQYRNKELKLNDLQYYKQFFDKAIREKNYSGLETIILEIPFRIQFANYMAVSPPFDIRGKKIKALDKKTRRLKFVFFTSFPVERKSFILISVLKEDLDVYQDYFEQIRNSPLELMEYYINVFIPLYSQNLIISPSLWEGWSEFVQSGVQFAVADPHSVKLLKGLQFYLKNIAKSMKKEEIKIDSRSVAFDFFVPYKEH
ncbi:SEC-C domain-containing protein [Desulfitobacterium sp. Sab5]|uniref:SEC-C domain-containing protein n=1 Tax=Desulfitobacterium nosdiversum TaxID=3375356 RepID=UPI003CF6EE4C